MLDKFIARITHQSILLFFLKIILITIIIFFICKLTNDVIYCIDFDRTIPTPKNPKGREIIIIDSDYYHSSEKQERLNKFIADTDQKN